MDITKLPAPHYLLFFQPISCQGTIKGVTHGVGTPRAARAGLGGCCSPPRPSPCRIAGSWDSHGLVAATSPPASLGGWRGNACQDGSSSASLRDAQNLVYGTPGTSFLQEHGQLSQQFGHPQATAVVWGIL